MMMAAGLGLNHGNVCDWGVFWWCATWPRSQDLKPYITLISHGAPMRQGYEARTFINVEPLYGDFRRQCSAQLSSGVLYSTVALQL